jgi:methionine biosynthesis protein MetW
MSEKIELRIDQKAIVDIIDKGSAVLDLGCGHGELLAVLVEKKKARAQGIEIDDDAIMQCVARGLNVFHDDIDRGLSEYGDKSFDYVILNQTFQQVQKLDNVLKEALRVGRKVIIGFPNFATLSTRWQLGIMGRTPVSPSLPYEWYDTPNLHFLSLHDFEHYCRVKGMYIEQSFFFTAKKRVTFLPNFFANVGVFLLSGNRD